MYFKSISLHNFRNLEDTKLEFDKNINVVYGENAQGKTNLLEALWLFTGGHSFRGNKDTELTKIKDGKHSKISSIKTEFVSEKRDQKAVLNIENGKRNSVINGIKKRTGSALVGKICAVVFSPEHLKLIKEGPSGRRSFIDGAICQIEPSYISLLSKYNRVIIQRNALLKEMSQKSGMEYMLDIWNEKAAEFGMKIIKKRYAYKEKLNECAKEIINGLSESKEEIEINYRPLSISYEKYKENPRDFYINALNKNFKNDLRQGVTSVGPHRDDLDIDLNGLQARLYASQGQQRSIVVSMKLSEAKILEENIGESPIILFDDVMSELDKKRQDYILNKLSGGQIFISCCDDFTVKLMESGNKYKVENGKVIY